jgi:hypothetical protein
MTAMPHSAACLLWLMMLGLAAAVPSAGAQTADSAPPTRQAGGLRVTILGLPPGRDGALNVQIALANETKIPQAVFWVGDRKGALNTGDFFTLSEVVGIAACLLAGDNAVNLQACREKYGTDAGFASALEPGEFTTATLRFAPPSAGLRYAADTTFSFTVKLLARPLPLEGQSPGTGDIPRLVTFNFLLVPVKRAAP